MKFGLILFLISTKALAFLPGGKLEKFSFKEQSRSRNYIISGELGFVSHVNQIFSAEMAVIIIQHRATNEMERELHCDELTYELGHSYISCLQGTKYLSLNLKLD